VVRAIDALPGRVLLLMEKESCMSIVVTAFPSAARLCTIPLPVEFEYGGDFTMHVIDDVALVRYRSRTVLAIQLPPEAFE
jgi:hypothetical protein